MDTIKFNDELNEINKKSYGYGNEILYLMAQDPKDLQEQDKLAGAMWLIGRSYAASPQRRSYGTIENLFEYINSVGKKTEKCPIWPVRTQNDGRENFFDEIANKLQPNIKPLFDEFLTGMHSLSNKYAYDKSAKDYDKLIDSIYLVLKFNLLLSTALEKFDKVPANNTFNGNNIYCSNHISFSSKFLHFYFPHRVFIIDNFARDGGKCLFNGYSINNLHAFYDSPTPMSNTFEKDVYDNFPKTEVRSIYNAVIQNTKIINITKIYDGRLRSGVSITEDNLTIKDYIDHCVRSYLLGWHITNKTKITLINQIKYNSKVYSLKSMPRLTDAIFLNIKSKLSQTIKNHFDAIERIYSVQYINKDICLL